MKGLSILKLVGIIALFSCEIQAEDDANKNPVVQVAQGKVKGDKCKSKGGRPYHRFRCIPYGKQKRFEPSEPADAWEGTYDASHVCATHCAQKFWSSYRLQSFVAGTTEDCLFLNVHAPAQLIDTTNNGHQKERLLPVMVYIHAGHFILGIGTIQNADLFMDHDVLLVTINYRLGVFGFLSSGDGILESNLGIKDMILALRWVQTNIKNFGGDPNQVTIFGVSAGGATVSLMLLSPETKGLFHHAIAQSGSALLSCAYQNNPRDNFARFTKAVKCTRNNTEESVACLKKVDVSRLVQEASIMDKYAHYQYSMLPAIEYKGNQPRKSKPFLTDHPRKLLKEGNFHRIPLIVGVIEDEAANYVAGFLNVNFSNELKYNWKSVGPYLTGMTMRNVSREKLNQGLEKARRYYFPNGVTVNSSVTILHMVSDNHFNSPMDTTVRLHSQYAPAYSYIFVRKGGLSFGSKVVKEALNRSIVCHAEDLKYLFFPYLLSDNKTIEFAKNFVKLWVSFATHGKPTATWGSVKTWPQVQPNTFDYKVYVIDDDPSVVVNPFKEADQFRNELDENEWNELGDDDIGVTEPIFVSGEGIMATNVPSIIPMLVGWLAFIYAF